MHLKIKFIYGETLKLKFLIENQKNSHSVFIVRNAKYELTECGETLMEGECDIDDHVISFLLTPPKKSKNMELILTYEIGDERLKDKFYMEVN